MTYQGRSLDDMPLAAYSTGATREQDDEAIPEPPRLSQQEAMALILGIDAAAPATPNDKPARKRARLPRPSLQRPKLPRLPSGPQPAAAQSAATPEPTMAAAPLAAASMHAVARQAAATASIATPAGSASAMSASMAQPAAGVPGRWSGVGARDLRTTLRDPRRAMRDKRVLASGAAAVGIVLVGVVLLGTGIAPAGGLVVDASPTAPAGAGAATAAPGLATIQLTGKVEAAYSLMGSTGFGRPADGQLASTWTDATGTLVSLTGRTASGTRTTAAELVLVVTVMINKKAVTFTSDEGDCTIGMAEKVFTVQGSFVCPKVASDDGKLTIKITGSYQT